MKATVANLVTPHLLKVVDLAKQAEIGGNIEWHLRETVSRTIEALGHQYNARDLLTTYIESWNPPPARKGGSTAPMPARCRRPRPRPRNISRRSKEALNRLLLLGIPAKAGGDL